MSKHPGRMLGCEMKLPGRPRWLAPCFVQAGEFRGVGAGLVAEMSFPRLSQRFIHRPPPCWKQAVEERLLIENVDERVAEGRRAIRKFVLAHQSHQAVHAVESLQ